MSITDQFRKMMTIDACMNTSGIATLFRQVTQMLFESFAIQIGGTKKEGHSEFYHQPDDLLKRMALNLRNLTVWSNYYFVQLVEMVRIEPK